MLLYYNITIDTTHCMLFILNIKHIFLICVSDCVNYWVHNWQNTCCVPKQHSIILFTTLTAVIRFSLKLKAYGGANDKFYTYSKMAAASNTELWGYIIIQRFMHHIWFLTDSNCFMINVVWIIVRVWKKYQ